MENNNAKHSRYRRIRYSLFLKSVFHIVAMFFPSDRVRIAFYRLRGTKIGSNVGIAQGVFLEEARPDLITIEDNVHIGPNVIIATHDSSMHCINPGVQTKHGPVRVGKNSFIGAGSVVLPGVKIGRGSVIAAGSVVTRDVPDGKVAAGVPAKVIKSV